MKPEKKGGRGCTYAAYVKSEMGVFGDHSVDKAR
jgi:hypothetical protein